MIDEAVKAARRFIIDYGTRAGVTPDDLARRCHAYSTLTGVEREQVNVRLCAQGKGIAYVAKDGSFIYWPIKLAPEEAL